MEDYLALQRLNITADEESPVEYYKRILIENEIIHSKMYKKVEKRNSYTVLLKTDEIFEIENFFIIKVGNQSKCFAVRKYFRKQPNNFFPDRQLIHLIFIKLYPHRAIIEATMIDQKVTIIPMPHCSMSVVCKLPHKFELLT